MFNIFDELQIGMAAREAQKSLEREAIRRAFLIF